MKEFGITIYTLVDPDITKETGLLYSIGHGDISTPETYIRNSRMLTLREGEVLTVRIGPKPEGWDYPGRPKNV